MLQQQSIIAVCHADAKALEAIRRRALAVGAKNFLGLGFWLGLLLLGFSPRRTGLIWGSLRSHGKKRGELRFHYDKYPPRLEDKTAAIHEV